MRIYDLTDQPVVDQTYYIPIDNPLFPEAMKISVANLFADEVTDRTAADDLIALSAGLETDYTFLPDPASNYITANDFIAAGYAYKLKNAILLLDSRRKLGNK